MPDNKEEKVPANTDIADEDDPIWKEYAESGPIPEFIKMILTNEIREKIDETLLGNLEYQESLSAELSAQRKKHTFVFSLEAGEVKRDYGIVFPTNQNGGISDFVNYKVEILD